MVVWVFSVDTIILHTFISAPACTDMVYSKALECDVTTTAPESFGIYSLIENDRLVVFFMSEGLIRASMYMP